MLRLTIFLAALSTASQAARTTILSSNSKCGFLSTQRHDKSTCRSCPDVRTDTYGSQAARSQADRSQAARYSEEWIFGFEFEEDYEYQIQRIKDADEGQFPNLLIDGGFQWTETLEKNPRVHKYFMSCIVETTQIDEKLDFENARAGETKLICNYRELGADGFWRDAQDIEKAIELKKQPNMAILFKPVSNFSFEERCKQVDGVMDRSYVRLQLETEEKAKKFWAENKNGEASPNSICLVQLKCPGYWKERQRVVEYNHEGKRSINGGIPAGYRIVNRKGVASLRDQQVGQKVSQVSEPWLSPNESLEEAQAKLNKLVGIPGEDLSQKLSDLEFVWKEKLLAQEGQDFPVSCTIATDPIHPDIKLQQVLASGGDAELYCTKFENIDGEWVPLPEDFHERIKLHPNMEKLFNPISAIIQEKCRTRQGKEDFPEIPEDGQRAMEFWGNFGREGRKPSTPSVCLVKWEWYNSDRRRVVRMDVRMFDSEGYLKRHESHAWRSNEKYSDVWSLEVPSLREAKAELSALMGAGVQLVETLLKRGFQLSEKLSPSDAQKFVVDCVKGAADDRPNVVALRCDTFERLEGGQRKKLDKFPIMRKLVQFHHPTRDVNRYNGRRPERPSPKKHRASRKGKKQRRVASKNRRAGKRVSK